MKVLLYRVAPIPGKDRGVIAEHPIPVGTVIERSPMIVIPAEEAKILEETVLGLYVYEWGYDDSVAVALGVGSLFNHSYGPNVLYTRDYDAREMVFTSLRDIRPGEELTINYNGVPDRMDPIEDFDPI